MVSVFNIEQNNLTIKDVISDYNFNFLDPIKEDYNINYEKYYQLLNSMLDFKMKNIYHFIYLRVNKIYKKKILKNETNRISKNDLNSKLNDFINGSIVRAIIIMNSIQLYFFPQISL